MKNQKFFNRELSWIEFNARVLDEALSDEVPLLERLRFLAIVSSNFDEFFMIRVAGLKRKALEEPGWKDASGFTAKQQLLRISKRTHEILNAQYSFLNAGLFPKLASCRLEYVPAASYNQEQHRFVQNLFKDEIFPLLTPLRTDFGHFPHITNMRLHVAFLLNPLVDKSPVKMPFMPRNESLPCAIVQVPRSISRVIWLPSPEGKTLFTLVEDVITLFGSQLFPGYRVKESLLFKLVRDADFPVDEDSGGNFIKAMKKVLQQRKFSLPVYLECNSGGTKLKAFLKQKLRLSSDDIYSVNGVIDASTLTEIAEVDGFSELKYPAWKEYYPAELDPDQPMWDILKHKDILLNVPYQPFGPLISFINNASRDPDVLAIKMTLYRTSGNSPIIQALERAARNGKQVTVFVELKARFDERRNISWASKLEQAGVIVVYGIANLKVHAKMLLVVRREQNGIRRYVHLSTGNYNDKTARQYSDLSLFTTNPDIANDATLFFNMISGYSAVQVLNTISMAPVNLKENLLAKIEREIRLSSPENPGFIMAKMNSLADEDIIKALYRASCADVKILLNVRGICMLVPGIKKQSENIRVVSVIDRYLEHSRIFYFQNGGAEEIYLSSADWMPRNLERRVEIMFPVMQKDLCDRVKELLELYFKDNTKSSELQSDGSWKKLSPAMNGESPFRIQETLYKRFKQSAKAIDASQPLEFVVRRKD